MPKYSYKAKDENGKLVTGLLQAADERDLHQTGRRSEETSQD